MQFNLGGRGRVVILGCGHDGDVNKASYLNDSRNSAAPADHNAPQMYNPNIREGSSLFSAHAVPLVRRLHVHRHQSLAFFVWCSECTTGGKKGRRHMMDHSYNDKNTAG